MNPTDAIDWITEYKFLIIVFTFIISCGATLIAVAKEERDSKKRKISRLGKWLIAIAILTMTLQITLSVIEERSANTEKEKQQQMIQEKFQIQLDSIEKVTKGLLEIQQSITTESGENLKRFRKSLDQSDKIRTEQAKSNKLFEPYYPFKVSFQVKLRIKDLNPKFYFDNNLMATERILLEQLKKKKPIVGIDLGDKGTYDYCYVNENYAGISDFEFLEASSFKIEMQSLNEDQCRVAKTATPKKHAIFTFKYFEGFEAEVCDIPDYSQKVFTTITMIMYDSRRREFEIAYEITCLADRKTDGTIKSFDDVMNAAIKINPGIIVTHYTIGDIQFSFAPDFSRDIPLYGFQADVVHNMVDRKSITFFLDEKYNNCEIRFLGK